MGKACTVEITRDLLYQLYYTENLTAKQVARHIGCRTDRVLTALNEYGFFKKACNVTKEWLIEHFVTLHQTPEEIGSLLGCDESSVRYHLRKLGITIKKRGKARVSQLNDREWLYEHYVIQNRSLHDIADLTECNITSVVHALVRLDITRDENMRGHYGQSRRRSFVGKKRQSILERDRHQCRFPDCTSTTHLELHHIIPIAQGGLDSVQNGITLCKQHHRSIASRETEYIPLFLSLLNQEPFT